VEVYVARQPILDRFRRTYGYELLFRDGPVNAFSGGDPDVATAKVIDTSFFVLGIEAMTGTRRAFVNFTRDALVGGYASALPSQRLVIEILEDVPADAEVVESCRKLKAVGYTLALDDVVTCAPPTALLALADIVKVDFGQADAKARSLIAKTFRRSSNSRLLAEKVETEEDFVQAVADGYHYFQGYFFARPTVISGREVPASKLSILALLREVHRPDPSHAQIENVIKHEVSLALKLLTLLRTGAWGFRQPIDSVRQAVLMLGDRGLKRWASLVAMAMLGADLPNELVVTSVRRARFCEGVLREAGCDDLADAGFLLGLFSLIDAFLGLPLIEAVERLPLSDDVCAALLGQGNNVLHQAYSLVLAWDRGAWDEVSQMAGALGLSDEMLAASYRSALKFGDAMATR
jgi:EAL and modified HD-GYP domain-containing signal transduction protein